jgi:4-amino-4-deoxy-L-arabinose transferase-like glycosyltransferase
MPALKNSKRSPGAKRRRARTVARPGFTLFDIAATAIALAALSAAAIIWINSQGYTLYYGDAEAHLNIARRIVDSRTPGYDQVGTTWLPLPHALMLPFVGNDGWWRSGLAGAFPAGACFVIAGTLFYAAVRAIFDSRAAGFAAVALFALNPNVLYLQAIPMTEAVFFAGLCGILFSTVWFGRSQSMLAVAAAGVFSLVASLTRYEGWFLIPFVALYFLVAGGQRRIAGAVVFSVIACLAPLYWLAHNAFYFGDPLYFYTGPYSAKGIYERALRNGMARYGGDHDWRKAMLYYRTAAQLCAGVPLTVLGVIGLIAAAIKRAWWGPALLLLPCIFYVMSMYSSGTPIFVPSLWPVNSYYNTRYGLVAVLLFSFGTAALVALLPAAARGVAASGCLDLLEGIASQLGRAPRVDLASSRIS